MGDQEIVCLSMVKHARAKGSGENPPRGHGVIHELVPDGGA